MPSATTSAGEWLVPFSIAATASRVGGMMGRPSVKPFSWNTRWIPARSPLAAISGWGGGVMTPRRALGRRQRRRQRGDGLFDRVGIARLVHRLGGIGERNATYLCAFARLRGFTHTLQLVEVGGAARGCPSARDACST